MSIFDSINRLLGRFKTCRTCRKQEPRGFTQSADTFWICEQCKGKTVAEVFDPLLGRRHGEESRVIIAPRSMANKSEAARMATALRSDPTRRALRNQGDDLDPLNPASLTSPLNPVYHVNDRNDWDDSSHRHHSSHDSDSSPSYDSGDSSTPSGGACD